MALIGDVREREHRKFVESPTRPDQTAVETVVSNQKYNPVPIVTGSEDSFGRIKVANPYLLFDSSFQYTLQEEIFISQSISGGSVLHDPNKAAAVLSCTSTPGSIARFRTRNYFAYSPAFTNTLFCSFNLKGNVAGVKKTIGQFDPQNGYFIQLADGTIYVAIRSTIGGITTETKIPRANWNLDKLDGTGSSGKTLDTSKQQILHLQYQWLGSGSVVFSFIIDNLIIPVHSFNFANISQTLYSQTATLPIQTEIENVSGSASTMEFTCCSLVTNGGMSQHGHLFSISSGQTPKNLSTAGVSVPIISLRKKAAFNKVPVAVLDAQVFCTSADDFLVQIVFNPTLTGAVWADIPNALCQRDVTATAWSGGRIVAETYLKGNMQASAPLEQLTKFWDLTLGNDFASNSDVISIVATPLTTNAQLYGNIAFKEFE